jgi:hypothetical protein
MLSLKCPLAGSLLIRNKTEASNATMYFSQIFGVTLYAIYMVVLVIAKLISLVKIINKWNFTEHSINQNTPFLQHL